MISGGDNNSHICFWSDFQHLILNFMPVSVWTSATKSHDLTLIEILVLLLHRRIEKSGEEEKKIATKFKLCAFLWREKTWLTPIIQTMEALAPYGFFSLYLTRFNMFPGNSKILCHRRLVMIPKLKSQKFNYSKSHLRTIQQQWLSGGGNRV